MYQNVYEQEQKVGYFQLDERGRMSSVALLFALQEIAIAHADSLGYTLSYLASVKRGWAVVNWHIRIHQIPQYKDVLHLETWCSKCRRLQADRSFSVVDETGELVADAASRWVYMDFDARKPTNITGDMVQQYISDKEAIIPEEKFRMPKKEEGQKLVERDMEVTRRDTDTNRHANNVKYLEWALDDIPKEVYNSMDIQDIRIVYRKECLEGDIVHRETYVKEMEEGKEFLTFLLDAQGHTLAELATIWK